MAQMQNDLTQQFGTNVSSALLAFQLIEENLKLYITFSFKLIRIRLNQTVPFNFDGTEFENAPLERLLHIFARLTDNNPLVSRLNKLKKNRNFVAHFAFVEYLKSMDDPSQNEANREKLNTITKEAWVCFVILQEDIQALNTRIMGSGA